MKTYKIFFLFIFSYFIFFFSNHRYPPEIDPPPNEVKHFCLPSGAMLKSIPGIGSNEADSIFKEIMYGQSHSKRSDKCFIFMLDDKTNFDEEEEEKLEGVIPGRLYGICVVHSRIINSNVNDPTAGNQDTTTNSDQKDNGNHDTHTNTTTTTTENKNKNNSFLFSSDVCYAFITRFPLFDFFFQTIWDILSIERITRMELLAKFGTDDPNCNYE